MVLGVLFRKPRISVDFEQKIFVDCFDDDVFQSLFYSFVDFILGNEFFVQASSLALVPAAAFGASPAG
jgi:hypothetical protein